MCPSDDRWTAGDAYEAYMGRWSRQLADRFLRWLDPIEGKTWLDVGCGTGAVTASICRHAGPAAVVACDPSADFVDEAARRIDDPRVSFRVSAIGTLPERVGGFDHIVSGLMLNFAASPVEAVREMRSRASDGGTVSAYVWDYAGRMQFLRIFWDEAIAVDIAAQDLDEGLRFPICRPDILESTFQEAGLGDVVVDGIEIPTRFSSFVDYWQPLLGGTGPAPAYVASLTEARRAALHDRLEARMSPEPDGAIDLVARAWAVRGVATAVVGGDR